MIMKSSCCECKCPGSFESCSSNQDCSRIIIECSGRAFIQIGKCVKGNTKRIRTKRIKLRKGKNIISVMEYHDLKYGFSFCKGDKARLVERINLEEYDTSDITDMPYMFFECSSLRTIDLSSFNTSNATDMTRMFF